MKSIFSAVIPLKSNTQDFSGPFIHGSNSLILELLKVTNMQILPPTEMIKQFNVAPLGGELNYPYPTLYPYVAFGRLHATSEYREVTANKRQWQYTMDHIIKTYTAFKYKDDQFPIIFDFIDFEKHAFSEIDNLLIHIVRSKQSQTTEKLFWRDPKDGFEILLKKIDATIQIYWLALLLCKYIYPDLSWLESFEEQGNKRTLVNDAIRSHLNTNTLISKIIEKSLNIESIYHNPTPESLEVILDFLTLPPNSVYSQNGEKIKSSVCVFTTKFLKDYRGTDQRFNATNAFKSLCMNEDGGIAVWLKMLVDLRIGPDFFEKNTNNLKQLTQVFAERKALLEQFLTGQRSCPQINMQSEYITNPFPIILVYDPDKNENFTESTAGVGEYFASSPLTIGKEIKILATDTPENSLKLKDFLRERNVLNVEVLLFEQLKNIPASNNNNCNDLEQTSARSNFR